MRTRLILATIAIVVLALLIARNEGYLDRAPKPASQPTTAAQVTTPAPTPTATPTPTEVPIASGAPIPPVVTDTVLAGISQDMAKLRPSLRYQRVACSANPPQGAGGPPRCASGEADGTASEYMQVAGCEGAWIRATAVPGVLSAALDKAHNVYAAALLPADPSWSAAVTYGKYVVVFAPDDSNSVDSLALYLDDTGIVRATAGCAPAHQRVRDRSGAAFTFLIPPRTPLPAIQSPPGR